MAPSGPWELRAATPEQQAVVATCWAVDVDELSDANRMWVQSRGPGDAARPRMVTLASCTLTVLPPPGEVLPSLGAAHGRSARGLLALPEKPVPVPAELGLLGPDDAPR